jgi:hypothetical protein
MLGLVILALAETATGSPAAIPAFVQPDVAASQVAACGFRVVRPRFDDLLQEEVIAVSDVSAASEEQLRCAANASLGSNYYVFFPETIDHIYQPLYWRLSEERQLADARAWLGKRGLLARLPVFDPKKSTDFAQALEKLCGPKATGTLKPTAGLTTFTEGALSSGRLDEDTFLCLMNAAKASGQPLGFVGNEAYSKDR